MTDHVTVDEGTKTVAILKDNVYEKMKFFSQIVLPAFATLYFALAGLWGWDNPEKVIGTIAAVSTFLGVVLQISTNRYNRSDAPYDGNIEVVTDGGGVRAYNLVLDGDPEAIAERDSITFKVKREHV
jgi:hypothetical protein